MAILGKGYDHFLEQIKDQDSVIIADKEVYSPTNFEYDFFEIESAEQVNKIVGGGFNITDRWQLGAGIGIAASNGTKKEINQHYFCLAIQETQNVPIVPSGFSDKARLAIKLPDTNKMSLEQAKKFYEQFGTEYVSGIKKIRRYCAIISSEKSSMTKKREFDGNLKGSALGVDEIDVNLKNQLEKISQNSVNNIIVISDGFKITTDLVPLDKDLDKFRQNMIGSIVKEENKDEPLETIASTKNFKDLFNSENIDAQIFLNGIKKTDDLLNIINKLFDMLPLDLIKRYQNDKEEFVKRDSLSAHRLMKHPYFQRLDSIITIIKDIQTYLESLRNEIQDNVFPPNFENLIDKVKTLQLAWNKCKIFNEITAKIGEASQDLIPSIRERTCCSSFFSLCTPSIKQLLDSFDSGCSRILEAYDNSELKKLIESYKKELRISIT